MGEIVSNICGRTGLTPELVAFALVGMLLFAATLAQSAQPDTGRALRRELRKLNPNHAKRRLRRHWYKGEN